jgi:uncharacterized membrane protein YraQ (UPF0718 family)
MIRSRWRLGGSRAPLGGWVRRGWPAPSAARLDRSSLQPLLALLLVASATALLATRPGWLAGLPSVAPLETLATVFLGIVVEALPFLLLGVMAAAAVELWVQPTWLRQHAPGGRLLGPLGGLALGLALPVCECGVIPVARRLLLKGAPLSLAIAFLLAAPAANPISILATAIAFGGDPRFVLGRLAIVWLTAALVAVVFSFHPGPGALLRGGLADCPHDHDAGGAEAASRLERLRRAGVQAGNDFVSMGRWLVLGALLAATLQTLVPRAAWPDPGQGAWTSVVALMALAAVLSVCSVVDSFIALSFAQTLPLGAVLAFLAFGSMVDLKSALMYREAFTPGTVVVLIVLVAQSVLLAGVFVNVLLGY